LKSVRKEKKDKAMSPTITINGLTMCHKGSGGIATSTLPDICKTPTPVGPIEINYVNIAMDSDLADGSESVTADGGNSVAIQGCKFAKSMGDEPGSVGGVVSGVNLGEASFISFSPDVTIEGKSVCRLSDKMMMNKQNSACMAGIVIPPVTPATGVSLEVELEEQQMEIYLVDSENNPIPNADYKVVKNDGTKVAEGTLDGNGYALIENLDMENFSIVYPDIGKMPVD